MNGMQMRGGTEHELERLRGQVSETERQLYELRKYKADAEGLSDLRKTCESLQREVYELRIANNKLVGYKNDADRLPGVLAENSELKRRFMLASWNSNSKSLTARRPRSTTFTWRFLA